MRSSAVLVLALALAGRASTSWALTTASDPASHLVPLGDPFWSGVVRLLIDTPAGGVGRTGALVSARHVLTAAHCLTDVTGHLVAASSLVDFPVVPGSPTLAGVAYRLDPSWTGAFGRGDLAVVQLSSAAPAGARVYGLSSATPAGGEIVDLAG
jgi:hypothetical protein